MGPYCLWQCYDPVRIPTGIGQGLRRSIFSIAAILGPLWAGGALDLGTYYILLAVPLALLIFVTVSYIAIPVVFVNELLYILFSHSQILVMLSFVRLKEPKGKHTLLQ